MKKKATKTTKPRKSKFEKRRINSELSKKDFERYLERVEDVNYQGGSWALPEKATPLEKSKYELCKKVIIYKREKKLTTEKLAQKVNLSLAETEDILHYRTDYFTLDRLMSYASKLFPTNEVKITLVEKEKRSRLHA